MKNHLVHVDAYSRRRGNRIVAVAEHIRGGGHGETEEPRRAWVGRSNQDFRERIAELERSAEHPDHGYGQKNANSTALGRYQILESSMIDAGWKDRETKMWTSKAKSSGVSSDAAFLANAEAQEIAMADYMRAVEGQLRAKASFARRARPPMSENRMSVRTGRRFE